MVGDKGSKENTQITKSDSPEPVQSLAVARNGLTSSSALAALNVAVICDLLESRITSGVANAIGSQCARILKTKEMEFRYGSIDKKSGSKRFRLAEANS